MSGNVYLPTSPTCTLAYIEAQQRLPRNLSGSLVVPLHKGVTVGQVLSLIGQDSLHLGMPAEFDTGKCDCLGCVTVVDDLYSCGTIGVGKSSDVEVGGAGDSSLDTVGTLPDKS
jgi:hypothetical protein